MTARSHSGVAGSESVLCSGVEADAAVMRAASVSVELQLRTLAHAALICAFALRQRRYRLLRTPPCSGDRSRRSRSALKTCLDVCLAGGAIAAEAVGATHALRITTTYNP